MRVALLLFHEKMAFGLFTLKHHGEVSHIIVFFVFSFKFVHILVAGILY